MLNNKCVYAHKDLNGNIFYIGSGTIQRANTKELSETKNRGTCRGSKYSEKVKELNFLYDVDIIENNLSTKESLALEEKLILEYSNNGHLVNFHLPTKINTIDIELFEKYFYVNSESPTGLSWKVKWYSNKPDSPVGSRNAGRCGERFVVIFMGKQYQVHRIIMALCGFDLTDKVVDHIDGNPLNNSVSNLRVVTQKENRRNSKIRSDNTTGHSGVRFEQHRGHWIFNWYENGRRNTKTFHIRNYNNDKQLALEATLLFRENKLNSLGYSEKHGK